MATVKRIVVVHPTHEVHYTKVKANLWKIAHIQDGCCPVSGNPMEDCKTCSSCDNNTITSRFLCMSIHHSELHSQNVVYYDKDDKEIERIAEEHIPML